MISAKSAGKRPKPSMREIQGCFEVGNGADARIRVRYWTQPALPLMQRLLGHRRKFDIGDLIAQHVARQSAGSIGAPVASLELRPVSRIPHLDIGFHNRTDGLDRGSRLFNLSRPDSGDMFSRLFAGLLVGKVTLRYDIVGNADLGSMVIALTDVPADQPTATLPPLSITEVDIAIELPPM
jgi:hypothetical protein